MEERGDITHYNRKCGNVHIEEGSQGEPVDARSIHQRSCRASKRCGVEIEGVKDLDKTQEDLEAAGALHARSCGKKKTRGGPRRVAKNEQST